ncbi:hypothetical protein [Spirosoma rhododendri]|uniref:Thioredoxin domain-containing protein n=1 Tax=Spirosoma rhododendri TaxID=2728024 RepID=A0A7L5DIE2_9BACT|nr:hypothetical protein [Spirosoma rhododendri]QJD77162.1 hypothetical protein HH216_01065 [Spirosoma rhododendri]
MRFLTILFCSLLLSANVLAQVDSVIVSGRVRNLSARLYRDAPTVLVGRNNILQASRELIKPAPLNVDGTFRVSIPLIYSQEELYFTYGRISTAFLAAPGALTIDLNADSLFTARVPFRFGGVNAQVNQQYARYKAFEAGYADKPNVKKLSEDISGPVSNTSFVLLNQAFQKPFRAFAAQEKPFPLLARWVEADNRYAAASFLYDRLIVGEDERQPPALSDSVGLTNDLILTASRTQAMNRFATFANRQIVSKASQQAQRGLAVDKLSGLLLRYGTNLTDAEKARLQQFAETNSARNADLRFLTDLVRRNNEMIQSLVNYEFLIQESRKQYDDERREYMTAFWLVNSFPILTLAQDKLLYDYARPQLTNRRLGQSLDELYALETRDSVAMKQAVQTLVASKDVATELEVSPGVFVTRDKFGTANGSDLFDKVINANRGKVIYVLLTSNESEAGRQAALDAQRLRSTYDARDFAVVYLPMLTSDEQSVWVEAAARNKLIGDHLLLTSGQLDGLSGRLRANDLPSATIINRTGKVIKRNAPLPADFDEAKKAVDKGL